MRYTSSKRWLGTAVILIALAVAVPLINGCSTLGIATSEELQAVEGRLESSNRSTGARLDNLEKDTADNQQALEQMTATMNDLNERFAEARTWLETMNLDTITQDSQRATAAATAAETRIRAFLTHYLEMLKNQQAALEKQIATIETKINTAPPSTPESQEPPAETSTDSEATDDSAESQDG
ncbi:MAG: hypothetical protein JSW50_04330 [Candidatus Latescibacterota bacterium]|nr:MAG: hypothetical protein JSW50_04330 [Candidatus Latescibacterota bacterium]